MKRRTDTMRVMIISHDRATIRALKIALGKKTEDISEIASAYSREQILSLTKREEFDLLNCDADMPGEEGVEALRELRQKKYRGGIILISSQCSPKMTREALRLEAGDFLLKPVEAAELWEAARGVIKRYKEKQEEELKRDYGDCWMENHMAIKELFWKDVCLGRVRNDPETISRKAQGCNIRLDEDARCRMVLITIKNVEEVQKRWGEELCQAAIQNLAKGIVKGNVQTSQVIVIYTRVVVLLDEREGERFREVGPRLVERCQEMLGAQILCYVSENIFCEEMEKTYSGLLRFSKDDVLCQESIQYVKKEQICGESGEKQWKERVILPSDWGEMIFAGQTDRLLEKLRRFLVEQAKKKRLDEMSFRILQQDLLQLFFACMEYRELKAHQLFEDPEIYKYYQTACYSIDGMCSWIRRCMELMNRLSFPEGSGRGEEMAGRIKGLIKENLKSGISRREIAEKLNLNPDYVNRLFKSETGMTVKEYAIKKRMKQAEHLLKHSDLAVSAVAAEVGYDNFSHFIRMFRKETGYTPKQYRKKFREINVEKT